MSALPHLTIGWANRQRPPTLAHGATGTQTVTDTVHSWRNVAPCGN